MGSSRPGAVHSITGTAREGTETFSVSEQPASQVPAKDKPWESGIFVLGQVHGRASHFLVDTGASVSVLSLAAYEELPQSRRPTLRPPSIQICGVAGTHIPISGVAEMTLVFAGVPVVHEMVVADIPLDAILGQDILLEHQGKLDLSNLTLRLKGVVLTCWTQSEGHISCRVIIKNDVTIPPWSQQMVPIDIVNAGFLSGDGLIQPSPQAIETYEVLLLPGVISTRKDKLLARLVNFGEESVTLHSRLCIGSCESYYENEPQRDAFNSASGIAVVDVISGLPPHLQELLEDSCTELTPDERYRLKQLLIEFQGIFAKDKSDMGKCNLVKHKINTGTTLPIKLPPRRLPIGKRQIEREEVQSMLNQGVIQPSVSPWASPVVLVKKKDGSTRFCVDYRRLNDVTTHDAYPIPRVDDSLDALAGGKWFNTMDLMSGFWQIAMDPESREKTAFATSSMGLFEFRTMPFGLTNAPATFQRLMESVLRGLQWEECLLYLDDIIVVGSSVEQCLERLRHVFQRLRQANLKLKPSKCAFFRTSVKFLGHIVSKDGVHTDPEKIKAVREWPAPKSVKDVRSFMGLCSYYRRFISRFAERARALHKLTAKGVAFEWTETCQTAFDDLKGALTSAPILAYPLPEGQYLLDTDASGEAVGAVLSQDQDKVEKVIGYYSNAMTRAEQSYCVTRKELLAVVLALRHFHPYIYGRHIILRTDNSAVSWMRSLKAPTGQTARWLETIGTYDLEVVHRPGRVHNNADALSRKPCASCAHQQELALNDAQDGAKPVTETQDGAQPVTEAQNCAQPVTETQDGAQPATKTQDGAQPVTKTQDGAQSATETQHTAQPAIDAQDGAQPAMGAHVGAISAIETHGAVQSSTGTNVQSTIEIHGIGVITRRHGPIESQMRQNQG